jgi:lytic murein transglycosylase
MLRRALPLLALTLWASAYAASEPAEPFGAFLDAVWKDAATQGISRTTFDSAFAGVTPDGAVLATMRRAPEYGKPFGAYVQSVATPARIATAQRKWTQWRDTLRAVEAKFQVDAPVIVSIWGLESSFGDAQARWDVFRSIATLAYARHQEPFFRNELLSALTILQAGHITRKEFLGSWAGAMGQPQFMPSSFLKYAVDFDGDGRADIWRSVPDVLASTGNYVRQTGWQPGVPWGFEVVMPRGFDYRTSRGSFRQWAAQGLKRADGGRFPESGDAMLFFPSGAAGPAFLVTENFNVLKQYNNSDAYALAVAHLADRMRGQGPIIGEWPANDFQPSRSERIALQYKLAELGYSIQDFTGHFDFALRDDVRSLQRKYGMLPDGHPSRAFLDRIGLRPQ